MKTAVIYWSGTGNTEAMAKAVADGASAELYTVSAFDKDITSYDKIALGSPAMGAEVIEKDEFEPFFDSIKEKLSGKTVALFGSYGWGDGEWMRNWVDSCKASGINVLNDEGIIVNESPSDDDLEKCKALGMDLVK